MFLKKKKYDLLNNSIDNLADTLEKGNVRDLANILGNKKEIIVRNLIAGIFRGVGIGVGVTVVTALMSLARLF